MLSKVLTLFHTVRYLKVTQIFHQLKYRLVKPGTLAHYGPTSLPDEATELSFARLPPVQHAWDGEKSFEFLNLKSDFRDDVDWSFQGHGKLWNYNLQYANYLLQVDVSDSRKSALMTSLYDWLEDGRLMLEPYPVSLRAMNMLRWFSASKIKDASLEKRVFAELNYLSSRLEFHLLGNHLLENVFALMMGGAYFNQTQWVEKAEKILRSQLGEQILDDGGHFELSPMYHQIIFFRLLELIDWYSSWERRTEAFERFLRIKAHDMLAWLDNISFENGDIPHFNDSTTGIAFGTPWLTNYAAQLNIHSSKKILSDSGYRSVRKGAYEIKIDFAQIGPSYQPGHAHADALSFILYHRGLPLLVEQGTSTYQIGERRSLERSTQAHNTVVVNSANQSEVWSGFRVGKRARTLILVDHDDVKEGSHDGYRRFNVVHRRSFAFNFDCVIITDTLSNPSVATAYFHLHPAFTIDVVQGEFVLLNQTIRIEFKGAIDVNIESYEFADQYNIYAEAQRICVTFEKQLTSSIYLD